MFLLNDASYSKLHLPGHEKGRKWQFSTGATLSDNGTAMNYISHKWCYHVCAGCGIQYIPVLPEEHV
jgi:hypothetical protein